MLDYDEAGLKDLLARASIDYQAALRGAAPGNLFPSRVAWNAASRLSLGSDWMMRLAVPTSVAVRVETVQAPKLGQSTRPIADMPLEAQLVYGVLTAEVVRHVAERLVEFTDPQTYRQFEAFPLQFPDAKYVLEADVASFYEYVDHRALGDEIVRVTGRGDVAEWLIGLLETWFDGTNGLPQGPAPSQPLADIYISPASRRLWRGGFDHSRYSDDFRVPTDSWSSARRAQSVLEDALRSIGLVLSPGKIRIVRSETYRRYVSEDIETGDEFARAGPEAPEFLADLYVDDTDSEPTVTAAQARRARTVLNQAMRERGVDVLSTRRVRRSLAVLGRRRSPAGIPHLGRLLIHYPHITPLIGAYVRSLISSEHEQEVFGALTSWISSSTFRYPWQLGWMFHTASHSGLPNRIIGDLAAQVLSDDTYPWFVRGQAAITVAFHVELPTQARFVDVYERAPYATKPDLVAAVVVGRPAWGPRFLRGVATSPTLAAVAALDRADYRDWLA